MQKGIIIFFAVFYAWASIGISVNAHYCLGQLESIEVFADIRSCCCGELEDKTGCCDDEHIQMQLDQAQQSANPLG